jgi:hypothetical protein
MTTLLQPQTTSLLASQPDISTADTMVLSDGTILLLRVLHLTIMVIKTSKQNR